MFWSDPAQCRSLPTPIYNPSGHAEPSLHDFVKDSPMPRPLLTILIVVAFLMVVGATDSFSLTVLLFGLILIAGPLIRFIRKNRYFASEQFHSVKNEIASVVAEHNEVVNYVEEIRAKGAFELGSSSTGQYAHLATFENSSRWKNRRDRNVAAYAPHVHNASLQIVRNASIEPIKYVMKYFSISSNQETLADVQRVADDISRLEQAVANVRGGKRPSRRRSIRRNSS